VSTKPSRLVCTTHLERRRHSSNRARFSYPAQLQVLLDVAFGSEMFEVHNFGVSGATAQQHGDLPYWTTGAFANVTASAWDVAVVMLGTNDVKPENWVDAEAFVADYEALLTTIDAAQFVVAIPPPLMLDAAYDMNATLINDGFPAWLPTVAAAYDAGVVDVFGALGGVADWRTAFPAGGCALDSAWGPCAYFCSDQDCDECHPNDVGYQRLAAAVFEAVTSTTTTTPGAAGVAAFEGADKVATSSKDARPALLRGARAIR